MKYATLDELTNAIDPHGSDWAPGDLAILDVALEAASRYIDGETGTRFYSAEEIRYYTADYPDLIYIDDLIAVDEIMSDSTGDGTYDREWTASEYTLEPRNALLKGLPYRELRPTNYYRAFPSHRNAVMITGTFGYSAEPPTAVKQACLLVAQRLYKRREAIFGIGSVPGIGGGLVVVHAQVKGDSDIAMLLSSVSGRSWL